jgi:hypothetical protein
LLPGLYGFIRGGKQALFNTDKKGNSRQNPANKTCSSAFSYAATLYPVTSPRGNQIHFFYPELAAAKVLSGYALFAFSSRPHMSSPYSWR